MMKKAMKKWLAILCALTLLCSGYWMIALAEGGDDAGAGNGSDGQEHPPQSPGAGGGCPLYAL